MNLDAKILGLEPLHDKYHPLSKREIARLERALGDKLPQDYLDFVSLYGDSFLSGFICVRALRKAPEHIADNGCPRFAAFYGGKGGDEVLDHFDNLKGRMPKTMFPFGSDYSGNSFCLGVSGKDRDKVYLWDHENEPDEEDYEDEGLPVPKDLWYENLTLLAKSFTDFLKRLYVEVDEE
jgi:hypothetical protein